MSTLTELTFRKCRMAECSFRNCTLKDVDLRSSDLAELKYLEALSGATIDPVQMVDLAPAFARALGITVES